MTETRADEKQSFDPGKAAAADRQANLPLVLMSPMDPLNQPTGSPSRVDVTGVVLDDIHIDPDITEGHPGYEETGPSEIIPLDRLAKRGLGPDSRASAE